MTIHCLALPFCVILEHICEGAHFYEQDFSNNENAPVLLFCSVNRLNESISTDPGIPPPHLLLHLINSLFFCLVSVRSAVFCAWHSVWRHHEWGARHVGRGQPATGPGS